MLDEIVNHLDGVLDNDAWADVDGAVNGLQVENSGAVDHVAFTVDASNQTFDRCYQKGVDMLVVHHGLFWGGAERITGQLYRRVCRLFEGDIALYASHLPLDAHDEVGNNVLLLGELGCELDGTFGDIGGQDVGRIGVLQEPEPLDDFVDRVEEIVGYDADVVAGGPDEVERVAALTGSGGEFVADAVDAGADVLVSGEPKHRTYHDAQEHGLDAVFAGHYHTERFGVRALRDRIDGEFDVETSYIEAPTAF